MRTLYRKLLIPVDGSALAETVFPRAAELAGRLGAEITLLHVCDEKSEDIIESHHEYIERTAETLRSNIEEMLKLKQSDRRRKAVKVNSAVASGSPADEIIGYSERHGISLILMATHSRSGAVRWAMGSVADRVARAARVPVLLARAGAPGQPAIEKQALKMVLVPLDGSRLAASVVPRVQRLVAQYGRSDIEIALLTIYQPPSVPRDYFNQTSPDWDTLIQQEIEIGRNAAQDYIDTIKTRLISKGFATTAVALRGKPAEIIIDYADANRCWMIAMATHGHSGISRWAYGSVAEKVIRGASCPVLLVRSKYADTR